MSDGGTPILPFTGQVPPPPAGHDPDLDQVEHWWRHRFSATEHLGDVIRHTFDQVLDAERTGRYGLSTLTIIERTYLSERFRLLLRDEFDLPGGPNTTSLPMAIDGVGVDAAFEPGGGWLIPQTSLGAVILMVSADDAHSAFSFGLLRPTAHEGGLTGTFGLFAIASHALTRVKWIWQRETMPQNILRELDPVDVQAIFALSGRGNGQARTNVLFQRVQCRILPRELMVTVAHQDDPMKRPRDARPALQPEGIVVLGHQKPHPRILRDLGLDIPRKGQLIAVRLVAATPQRQRGQRKVVAIGGKNWVVALNSEPTEPGPEWPYV
jgi:hypothetical protein